MKQKLHEHRTRFALQRRRRTDLDKRGQYDESWATIATGRCKVRAAVGREVEFGRTLRPICTGVIEMRFIGGLSTQDRIITVSRSGRELWHIGHIDDVERAGKLLKINVAMEPS